MCSSAAQCCAGQCSGGLCGPPACPSNGTACGDCIATKCCNQAAACLADPACTAALQCIFACVQMGGQPLQCFQQCGGNTKAIQAGLCAANSCGAGICL
jgi:hypothetical protein